MSHVINEKKHKDNLQELGRFGARVVLFFAALFGAVWLNFTYIPPQYPVFLIVLVFGAVYFVPRARVLMKKFEENARPR